MELSCLIFSASKCAAQTRHALKLGHTHHPLFCSKFTSAHRLTIVAAGGGSFHVFRDRKREHFLLLPPPNGGDVNAVPRSASVVRRSAQTDLFGDVSYDVVEGEAGLDALVEQCGTFLDRTNRPKSRANSTRAWTDVGTNPNNIRAPLPKSFS